MQDHNEWLKFAANDLRAAEKLAHDDDPVIGPAMFLTQQCAEKALKAFLAHHNEPIRRIHDLVALVNLCKQFDKQFELIESDAADLNPYLCKTRYPDDCLLMPDLTTLKMSIQQAHAILNFVIDKCKEQS